MADQKKETVRIDLPTPMLGEPPEPNMKPRETVRIQMPVPEPPSVSVPLTGSVVPRPAPPASALNKEVVRLPLMPDPLRAAQKKAPPLVPMPGVTRQNPSIAVAPAEKSSMLPFWVLLGVSALILIIQIW